MIVFAIGEICGFAEIIGPSFSKNNRRWWPCKCKLCGSDFTVQGKKLKSGHTKSCGCLLSVMLRKRNTVHNESKTPLHYRWITMVARCDNPNNDDYSIYGGRGITVCSGWRGANGYVAWKKDMGEFPGGRHSIDRIDGNGNYSCGKCEECVRNGWTANCRWANDNEQARNRKSVRKITAFGETRLLCEWEELSGIGFSTILWRINNGWTAERALTTPDRSGRSLSVPVVS